MQTVAKWMLAAITCAAMLSQADIAAGKKVIGIGWCHNSVTVDDLIEHADSYAATGLDGVTMWMRGKDAAGNAVGMRQIWNESWEYGMFADMVPKLKRLTVHEAFRECFLATFRSPTNRVDWTDDVTWERIAGNMRTAAAIARDGGCRGLSMDCEDYRKVRQFFRQPGEMPYGELCALARRRGAQTFRGVFEEYPDVRILSFWFLSWLAP